MNKSFAITVSSCIARDVHLCIMVYIWIRSRNCGRPVTWPCYQLIARPGNKTATVTWPDPYSDFKCNSKRWFLINEPSWNAMLSQQRVIFSVPYLKRMVYKFTKPVKTLITVVSRERCVVWNHNRMFVQKFVQANKKTMLRIGEAWQGIHRLPVDSPHKGPVMISALPALCEGNQLFHIVTSSWEVLTTPGEHVLSHRAELGGGAMTAVVEGAVGGVTLSLNLKFRVPYLKLENNKLSWEAENRSNKAGR